MSTTTDAKPAAGPTAGREPGAPVPPDEIDLELVSLKRPPPKIRVVTAAGLMVLCAYLLFRLVPDLTYSRADAPVAFDPARPQALGANRFVELTPGLDLARAIRVNHDKAEIGLRVAPVRSTNDRVWVAVNGDGWGTPNATGAPVRGRLRALADAPFADALRAKVASTPWPAFTTLAKLRAATGTTIEAVDGTLIAPTPDMVVEVDVIDNDQIKVVATDTERFPTTEKWTEALRAAGVLSAQQTVPTLPVRNDKLAATSYVIQRPGARATVPGLIEAAGLYAVQTEPVHRTLRSTWGQIQPQRAPLQIDGLTLDDAQVSVVRFFVPRVVPSDAVVIFDRELPGDYWYLLPLAIALAVIGALFAWALVHAIRRDYLLPRASRPAA